MLILIEDLPEQIPEEEIVLLVREYDEGAGVKLIDNRAATGSCSCLVSLSETDNVIVNVIAEKLDGLYWHGAKISAHRMLFG